jgi:hypothetical protein
MNDLRSEQLSLLIGTVIGQISELLNSISNNDMSPTQIYNHLNDIHQSSALQVHELYYKGNKP